MPYFDSPRRTLSQCLSSLLSSRMGGVMIFVFLFLGFSSLIRLVLALKSASLVDWNLALIVSFLAGTFFDLACAAWWSLPLVFLLASLPKSFFAMRLGRGLGHLGFFLLIYLLLFGAVAEWFFWEEFGVRFNFIAVDYLIYTKEVIGNIRESYPMPAIYAALFVGALLIHFLLHFSGTYARWFDGATQAAAQRWRAAGLLSAACLSLGLVVNEDWVPSLSNNYNRELSKNGLWSLFAAFRANALEYSRFYPTLANAEAFSRVRRDLSLDKNVVVSSVGKVGGPENLDRSVRASGTELRLNVIQITVESLSGEFFKRYGGAADITPNLDALMDKSLVFDNFYATGNRTDRGMEALSLSLPPTPGRSLVKRPRNERLFSLGSVFRSKGYDTAFIYGGYGYFDNMNYFFGENGYRVVDRTKVASSDIHFSNIWGACDEDLYDWSLREADADAKAGKPFHFFLMTTSNHRPFTFPAGRIDLLSKESGRRGGVKYTDYAIARFLEQASKRPWYKNTVFVIVADHCASSAGKTTLPVQNYHIPLIIFSPGGQLRTGKVDTLCSQVDYAPTLLGLLNFSYRSRFFGVDVLNPPKGFEGRAFIGNYQKLGMLRGNKLAVLSPVGQSATYRYEAATQALVPERYDLELDSDAIAYYQAASRLYDLNQYKELPQPDGAGLANRTE